ncbi:MAG: ATP-binding protein [Anaerolineae bacterium]
MASAAVVIALVSGLAVALSLGFWIMLAWSGVRAELLQFYGVLILFFAAWVVGGGISGITLANGSYAVFGPMLIAETGFLATSISLFSLSSAVTKAYSERVRWAVLSLSLVVVGYALLVQGGLLPAAFEVVNDDVVVTRQSYIIVLGPVMNVALLAMLWTVRRRQRDVLWMAGVIAVATSQLTVVMFPSLWGFSLALAGASGGMVVLGLGLLEREIVRPVRELGSQMEAMRTVTSAITSLRPLEQVLDDLARYSSELLHADIAGIFLVEANRVVLQTVRGLPRNYLGRSLEIGQGMVGASVAELQGQAVEDYAREWDGETDLPFARDVFGATLAEPLIYGGKAIGVLLVALSRNGRLFSTQDRALLQLLAEQGAVALQQSRLLAEQRALNDEVEAGRRQLESVLSSTESPVLAIARNRRVLFANPSARDLAVRARAKLDTPSGALIPREAFPKSLLQMERGFRRSGSYTYEVTLAGRSYMSHVAPLGRTRPEGWVVVLNDVTELKALDRMKSEMMRMTSHDLKNPLQAAMANLELLRDDIYGDSTDEVRESVDAVDQQLQRMYRIISGILDTERARVTTVTLATCRPERIIEAVAEDMGLFAREHGISLWTDCPSDLPDIRCEFEQFERALGNLVENGIKYTHSGGEVRLMARQDGDHVLFEVADTGVGIPVAVQPRIFERFFRGQPPGMEQVAGTGLGLSLVKAVVERHQGAVWFESTAHSGTRFFVRVPAANIVND